MAFHGHATTKPYPTGTCEQSGSRRAVRKETSRRVSSSHSVSGRLRRLRQNPSVGESWKAATLVWEEGAGDQFIAKVERGSVYAVYSTARIGYGSGYAARRKTRSGSGDIGLGHTDTSEQAKELCERHYTGRKD